MSSTDVVYGVSVTKVSCLSLFFFFYYFLYPFNSTVTFHNMPLKVAVMFTVHLTACVFPFHNTHLLLPRCPDGYFGPRCLQTEPLRLYMPNPFKSMSTWYEQLRRAGDTVGTGLPLWAPAALTQTLPPSPVLFLFHLLSLLLRSTRNELCTTPCTQRCHPWEHSASAVCSCAVVLILCLSPSLPLPLLHFFSYHTLLITPPSLSLSPPLPLSLSPPLSLPLSHSLVLLPFLFLTHPPPSSSLSLSLSLFLWLCFSPSGVQMTLLVIAVKPTLWPVSTVCQLPLLSLCQTVLVSCVHAERREDCIHFLLITQ